MQRRQFIRTAVGLGAGAALAAAVPAAAAAGRVARAGTQSRGGSNYGWYQLDGCAREAYGDVNRFQKAAGTNAEQQQTK